MSKRNGKRKALLAKLNEINKIDKKMKKKKNRENEEIMTSLLSKRKSLTK